MKKLVRNMGLKGARMGPERGEDGNIFSLFDCLDMEGVFNVSYSVVKKGTTESLT